MQQHPIDGYALQTGQMAFDKNGDLLVEESNLRQGVHVFRVSTRTFRVIDLKLHVGVGGPGLAVDGAGNLYASGYSGGIDVFAPGAPTPNSVQKMATLTINAAVFLELADLHAQVR